MFLKDSIIESLAVDAEIRNEQIINVIGIYKPPSANVSEFNNMLETLFIGLKMKSRSSIVAGDFNICLFKQNSDPSVMSFFNLMASFCLIPLINLPTREDYNCSSLIDNIWTNITSKSFSGVLNSSITDHYPIFSVFENF